MILDFTRYLFIGLLFTTFIYFCGYLAASEGVGDGCSVVVHGPTDVSAITHNLGC